MSTSDELIKSSKELQAKYEAKRAAIRDNTPEVKIGEDGLVTHSPSSDWAKHKQALKNEKN